jgi:phospholipid/cholesterol/gamma-HCH transport system substrate-binding protein
MSTNNEKCFSRAVTVEAIVGIFVALVLIALAVFTIVVSGSSLFKGDQFPIKVVMPDAMGLRRNDTVIARGTTVGTVDEVYFDRDGVHVRAMLTAPVEFHEGYRITVVSISILGGRQLVLFEGDQSKPKVADVLKLVGEQPSDIMDDATAAIKSLRDFLAGDFLEQLRHTASNLADISDRLEQGKGTLGKLLSEDDTLYRNLDETVSAVKVLMKRVENGEGTLGKLFSADATLYDDLQTTLANLRGISGRLERGEGMIGKLLSSDNAVYADLQASIANLRAISDRLERGESSLGKLLSSDAQVYDDIAAVTASFREVSERLAKGESTLGKLLSKDTELYDNVNGAVSDVREVIDDMREASPVSTFSSFIFGAF